ncbi:unnamed protein product [Owenia fusiformis]|uniref:Uncharacterized protein n=1 Tax=Owenia fusiformis TaxID=6347 RepID=A0A8J1UVP4_OWEFU|nr:unnamed protein product [Owenia fusiformis]
MATITRSKQEDPRDLVESALAADYRNTPNHVSVSSEIPQSAPIAFNEDTDDLDIQQSCSMTIQAIIERLESPPRRQGPATSEIATQTEIEFTSTGSQTDFTSPSTQQVNDLQKQIKHLSDLLHATQLEMDRLYTTLGYLQNPHSTEAGERYHVEADFEQLSSLERILGKGSFGVVTQRRLQNGTRIAVKQLTSRESPIREFQHLAAAQTGFYTKPPGSKPQWTTLYNSVIIDFGIACPLAEPRKYSKPADHLCYWIAPVVQNATNAFSVHSDIFSVGTFVDGESLFTEGLMGIHDWQQSYKHQPMTEQKQYMNCLREAVREIYWPSRVRTDFGRENNLVGEEIMQRRGGRNYATERGGQGNLVARKLCQQSKD